MSVLSLPLHFLSLKKEENEDISFSFPSVIKLLLTKKKHTLCESAVFIEDVGKKSPSQLYKPARKGTFGISIMTLT